MSGALIERLPTRQLLSRERAFAEYLAALIGAAVVEGVVIPMREAAPQPAPVGLMPVNVQQLVSLPNGSDASPAVYTVAGGAAMWPLSVMCRLTASAVAGDRTVSLEYQDQMGTRFLVAGTQAVVQASGVQSFCWHPQAGEVAWPIEDAALAPLPQQHVLPGHKLAVKVNAGQAGDVLDQVVVSARFDPLIDRD